MLRYALEAQGTSEKSVLSALKLILDTIITSNYRIVPADVIRGGDSARAALGDDVRLEFKGIWATPGRHV